MCILFVSAGDKTIVITTTLVWIMLKQSNSITFCYDSGGCYVNNNKLAPVTAHAASSGWSNGYARGTYDYANGNAFNDHCSFLHIQTVIALTTN